MFVERKTHRESWKGEESVKDRITLPKGKIVEFLDGTYTLDQAMKEGKVCSLTSAAWHLCAGVENQFFWCAWTSVAVQQGDVCYHYSFSSLIVVQDRFHVISIICLVYDVNTTEMLLL